MTTYPTIPLKEIEIEERPQERLLRLGASALSDSELLAMILRSGTKGTNVLVLAKKILKEAGSLQNLAKYSLEDFVKISGIGQVKGLQLLAIIELSERINSSTEKQPLLNSPEKIYQFLENKSKKLDIEKVWVLCLNRKNYLINFYEITSGIATSSLIHPREIFRVAIRLGCTAIVVVHNHPSGDPSPSKADKEVAKTLLESSKIICIELLDFMILGKKSIDPMQQGYYSFRENNLL